MIRADGCLRLARSLPAYRKAEGYAMKIPVIRRRAIIVCAVLIAFILGGVALNHLFGRGFRPSEGFVPDESTAIRIAEAVWLPIYGEDIYYNQPFVAHYDWFTGCWIVTSTIPENALGSVPEARIRKRDGKVMYVWH